MSKNNSGINPEAHELTNFGKAVNFRTLIRLNISSLWDFTVLTQCLAYL